MSDGTNISYVDATWPIVAGCQKISLGCSNCSAIRDSWRLAHNPNPKVSAPYAHTVYKRTAGNLAWSGVIRPLRDRLDWPFRWKKPRRVFVCNLADLFHPSVPTAFIDQVFAVMALANQHTFLLLTKHAERMFRYLADQDVGKRIGLAEEPFAPRVAQYRPRNGTAELHLGTPRALPLRNVMLGVSIENQDAADSRIPVLLKTPATTRWVSVAPLLGPVDLTPWLRNSWPPLDWIVVEGESGPRAQPTHPDWVRSLHEQCTAAELPWVFKQWGEWANHKAASLDLDRCYDSTAIGGWIELDGEWSAGDDSQPRRAGAEHVFRVGKKAAGHMLDGILYNEFPEVRQ